MAKLNQRRMTGGYGIEYWDKKPYDDPWIWFAKKSACASSFTEASDKFWDFVRATYPLVLKINEAANNPNKAGKV